MKKAAMPTAFASVRVKAGTTSLKHAQHLGLRLIMVGPCICNASLTRFCAESRSPRQMLDAACCGLPLPAASPWEAMCGLRTYLN